MTARAEGSCSSVLPRRDPVAEQVAAIVARITADPALRRVDELAGACRAAGARLQRLFAEYVGVGPKWVMRRARLHEAARARRAAATSTGRRWPPTSATPTRRT